MTKSFFFPLKFIVVNWLLDQYTKNWKYLYKWNIYILYFLMNIIHWIFQNKKLICYFFSKYSIYWINFFEVNEIIFLLKFNQKLFLYYLISFICICIYFLLFYEHSFIITDTNYYCIYSFYFYIINRVYLY